MRWSWKLGRAFGIDIFVHATFLILLGWVAVSGYLRERDARAMVVGVLFTLAIFGSVVLHELGHALTAGRFGIRTRDITLLPIGGIARLERMPDRPGRELLVALAGPAVNIVIALTLFLALSLAGQSVVLGDANLAGTGPFFTRLLWVNLALATFNMLPAFPMDGGRALRAVLAFAGDYVRATQVAAKLGQGIAVLLGIVGLLSNVNLVFIALFIWIGAAGEAASVQAKAALHALPVSAAMQTRFRTLRTNDTLDTAARLLLDGPQVDFPVLHPSGALSGVLTRGSLVAGLRERGPDAPVAMVMERRFAVAHPDEMLDVVLPRLDECPCTTIPVVGHQGQLVGLVTAENVGELMMIRDALRAPTPRAPFRFAAR